MATMATTNAGRSEFGLQMDSTEPLSHCVAIYTNVRNCLKQEGLKMVAREGYQQHYSFFSIPLNDVYLDPRLELR